MHTTTSSEQGYGLVGMCFVIFGNETTEQGRPKIKQQGIIRAYIPGDRVLVQFFDWVIGEDSSMAIYPMVDLEGTPSRGSGDWELFEDREHLQHWMQYGSGQGFV